jgi:hypothetical protein
MLYLRNIRINKKLRLRKRQTRLYGSAQTTEFDNTENRTFMRDSNLAEPGSVGPIEDVSKDFDKMNRGMT